MGSGIVVGEQYGGKAHIQHAPDHSVGPGPAGDIGDKHLHALFLKLICLTVNILGRTCHGIKGMQLHLIVSKVFNGPFYPGCCLFLIKHLVLMFSCIAKGNHADFRQPHFLHLLFLLYF